MQVTIKDVNVEWGGTGSKRWGKATVTYDHNGNSRRQNVMSFSNPEVFKKVQALVGETVDVEVGKNDKDFTEWRSISVNSAGSQSTSQPTTAGAAKSTTYQPRDFETKEERARRQVLIVKQSSLAQAVEITKLVNPKGGAVDLDEVERVAQRLTDWVLDTPTDSGSIEDMSNDIPF